MSENGTSADHSSVSMGHTELSKVSRTGFLSIVVPCYNEEEGLAELIRRACDAGRSVFEDRFELVLIDDGSGDATWPMIEDASAGNDHIVGVKLARNYGHQIALTAGLASCQGSYVLVLDADLQDPPELLGDMLSVLKENKADVVYGQRDSRAGESGFKKLTATGFYRLLKANSSVDIPLDAGDFRLMTGRAARIIVEMPEHDRFVRGMVASIGLKQVPFAYHRDARFAGETKYPIRKMLSLAVAAFMGFSMAPVRIAARLATLMFFFSGFAAVVAVIIWMTTSTVPGWTSLMVLVAISSAMNFMILAILGEYIGRIFMSQKRRPLYIVETVKQARSSENPQVLRRIGGGVFLGDHPEDL
ncbi:MAG: glycosyltransferase [Ponticaulis sp.]|nr:glycosyltransferase [Ponticaulis sp.]